MTAKEQAEELIEKYKNPFNRNGCIPPNESTFNSTAKQYAIIAVDEMIARFPFTDLNTYMGRWCEQKRQHLNEVKKEIEKL
jgi:hypothetical protein